MRTNLAGLTFSYDNAVVGYCQIFLSFGLRHALDVQLKEVWANKKCGFMLGQHFVFNCVGDILEW